MFPIRDNIPSRSRPIINYVLIALTSVAFLGQLAEPAGQEVLVEQYGMIPVRVWHPERPVPVIEQVPVAIGPGGIEIVRRERVLPEPRFNPWWTLLTCVFLHGGWMHFLGNMWFLHVFGDNVEDRLGHLGYLLFYLGCGVAASAAHLLTNGNSTIPTIGASGAIAGVMGAYMLLYPRSMVLTVIPIFIFIELVVLPAPLFLGIWFLLQFFQGTLSITSTATGGVAWWAHIGGFAVGFLIALALRSAGATRPSVAHRLPGTDHITYRRIPLRR